MSYQPDPTRMSCAGHLTIDLGALQNNWRALKARVGEACDCAAVVKANAYGLGVDHVVPALSAAGAGTFFVATPEEGQEVRALVPDAPIYVLSGVFTGRLALYDDAALRPILGHPDEISEWARFCEAKGETLPAGLHIDTGMNRLGLTHAQAEALANDSQLLRAFDLTLVMSHLACADDRDSPLNRQQLAAFERGSALFPGVPRSLANSSGVFLGADYHFELVRPGIALYGGNPTPKAATPMRCVATIEAEVIHLRDVSPGEAVGYGATRTAERPTRIATVNVGYADGMHRLVGSTDERDGAFASVGGIRCPLFGRVSMDMLAIDVTDVPEGTVVRGSRVEVMGPTISVDELAEAALTIPYELLTALGARYKRSYIGYTQNGEDALTHG
ncbi:alanine racemase [Pseudovibrio exalbescens]|nr:alanine racemase [Pseudovibrio exalbescens]